jgi:hypothetical protein
LMESLLPIGFNSNDDFVEEVETPAGWFNY